MSEQHSFADNVAQQIPFLTRTVRSLVCGDQMAEDIIQQTVLKALTHADQFRFESSLNTWLVSIAGNEIRQTYRSRSRSRAVPLSTENLDIGRSLRLEFPNNDYEARERAVFVRDAVRRLPHKYRSVVVLCDFHHVPMKEAARKLGLTLSGIKTRRHRARQKLRPLVARLK